MITKNYKKLMTKFLMSNWVSNDPGISDLVNFDNTMKTIIVTNYSGSGVAAGFANVLSENQVADVQDSSANGIIIAVGTGTVEPTEDDYTLDSLISHTDLPVVGSTVSVTPTLVKQFTYIMQNVTQEDITVNEIGIYLRHGLYNAQGARPFCALLVRELLDTPVTIQPSQLVTFTFEFRF